MDKTVKILLTIGCIFLYILIATPIIASMKDSGQSTGFIGIILMAALIGAIRAIWKKPHSSEIDKKEDDNNNSILQK